MTDTCRCVAVIGAKRWEIAEAADGLGAVKQPVFALYAFRMRLVFLLYVQNVDLVTRLCRV